MSNVNNRVEELKKMMVSKSPDYIKQHLMQNCSIGELTDIVIKLLGDYSACKVELPKQVTVSTTDYQLIMETFEKLFRIPESNGRGRKSENSHLSYSEQVRLIVLNPRLGRGVKQLRLDTLYQRELNRKRSEGEDVTNFTPPILEELLHNPLKCDERYLEQ